MSVRHFAWAGLGVLLATAASLPARAMEKAKLKEAVAPSEAVSFDIFLPQAHRAELDQLLIELHNPKSPMYRKWLTPAEFDARFGADTAKISAMEKELAGFGLTATIASSHHLHVTGNGASTEAALGTGLRHGVMANGKTVLVAAHPMALPNSLRNAGAVVAGLSGTVRLHNYAHHAAAPANRYSTAGPYWFDDLRQAYKWPSDNSYNGKGTTVAVMVDGGFNQTDMDLYFGHEGIASPKIRQINVLGGSAFDPNSDGSFEAELDIQQSGGMAPKANILLYSLPDLTDLSFISGLAQIIEDNAADVVSMSFGGPELTYTPSFNDGVDYTDILLAEDDLMAEGNALGITFVAASGDEGALSIPALACFDAAATSSCGQFLASAEFPASSPHVTGVGGTNLKTTYNPDAGSGLDSAYISEEAYADPLTEDIFYGTPATGGYWGSGGGDSVVFAKPLYQDLVTTGSARARTVPDLALHMGGCPGGAICNADDSADIEVFGDTLVGVIGTSASSPAFAGLTALNIERGGARVGNENYYIYELSAAQNEGLPYKIFHRNIPGFNGLYTSGNNGYNRVIGNGTLYGKDFILAPGAPSAGVPQTPSNK